MRSAWDRLPHALRDCPKRPPRPKAVPRGVGVPGRAARRHRLEVVELDWLKSGRASGLKSGSISSTWTASALRPLRESREGATAAPGAQRARGGDPRLGARSVPPAHVYLEEGAAKHTESPELRGSINIWSPPVPLRRRDGGQGRRTEARRVPRERSLPPALATVATVATVLTVLNVSPRAPNGCLRRGTGRL